MQPKNKQGRVGNLIGYKENSFDHTGSRIPHLHSVLDPEYVTLILVLFLDCVFHLHQRLHLDELGFISARHARVLVGQLDLLDCCLYEWPCKMPPI